VGRVSISLLLRIRKRDATQRIPIRKEALMKATVLVGILLIVLGVISLAYQGFSYTTNKKVLDIGSLQATKKETHNVPLPPILGGIALIGGISLLVAGSRSDH
jgi:uncharacterized membrane protein